MNEACVAFKSAGVVPGVKIDSQSSTMNAIVDINLENLVLKVIQRLLVLDVTPVPLL